MDLLITMEVKYQNHQKHLEFPIGRLKQKVKLLMFRICSLVRFCQPVCIRPGRDLDPFYEGIAARSAICIRMRTRMGCRVSILANGRQDRVR